MNIFLQNIKFILVLAFLGLAFVANAQPNGYEHEQIPLNDTLIISDIPNGLLSFPAQGHPDHGSLWSDNSMVYYQPDLDYMGVDTFYFEVVTPGSSSPHVFLGYIVQVSESIIITKRDFASTFVNAPVAIYPLNNDSITTGGLSLMSVAPIFNHGTVTITGNQFTFTPEQGFKGITHMGYIACNDFGKCEKGIISVMVYDYNLPESQSAQILTSESVAIPVLLPYDVYVISQSPAHGTLEFMEDFAYLYTPNAGFTGTDEFSFTFTNSNGTSEYTVEAKVMNLPAPNLFANDDYGYTEIGEPLVWNVLDNDNGNLHVWSLQLTSAPSHGSAWLVGNGKIKYVPTTNYQGVDKFTYQVANALGVVETATIYMTVSNFTPGASSFDLATYDDTPIYFDYDAPIDGYTFNVLTDTSEIFGTIAVEDNTIIHYTPLSGFIGQETVSLEYCVKNGNCFPFEMNIEVTANPNPTPGCSDIADDCVWAGDTNRDGIVDGKDVLYLCAIGEVGIPRAGNNSDWIGQYAISWNNPVQGVNKDVKHIDTNGDSLITMADRSMVDENYGKRNKITSQIPPTQQNPLIFNALNNNPQPGDTIEIEVLMGTTANPAIDYSGITFQVAYNPLVIDTAFVVFEEHSWLGYDAPIMDYQNTPYDGKLDVAFTRGDETTKSGFGKIGSVYIIIEDIQGIKSEEEAFTLISFENSYSLTGGGHLTKLNDEDVKIILNEADFTQKEETLVLSPNPTAEKVTIATQYYNTIKQVQILNMMGQVVAVHQVDNTNRVTLDVSRLESGMYIVYVDAENGPIAEKLEVFK